MIGRATTNFCKVELYEIEKPLKIYTKLAILLLLSTTSTKLTFKKLFSFKVSKKPLKHLIIHFIMCLFKNIVAVIF